MPKSGFTLLEILIVLGLIAFISLLLLPRLTRPKTNFMTAVRDLTVLSKEVRNSARLKKSTYRLVFELGVNENEYWLEVAPGRPPIAQQDSRTSDDAKKKSPFQKATAPLKGVKKLPGKLYFQQLETLHQGIQTSGEGYVHFSPDGLVEKSALLITDGKNLNWTLVFHPLTGQVDVMEQAIGLKDLETP